MADVRPPQGIAGNAPPPAPASVPTPRLEVRDVVVRQGGRRVLEGVSVTVRPGEVITIQGASGGGKTTLLRALALLSAIDAGTILLDGVDINGLDPMAYRVRVAYVAQQPAMLEGTVADNLAVGPRLRGATLTPARIQELMALAGVPEALRGAVARKLSGGEKQRVALARALANSPQVLLLDEPTAALDPEAAAVVIASVRALASQGVSAVVVTHTADHAAALGGTHYQCAGGRLDPVAVPG